MTYYVSSGTLNPTHSYTLSIYDIKLWQNNMMLFSLNVSLPGSPLLYL